MCQFFSAIVLRNGDVLHHWATDSHSDLVTHFKLPDNSACRHFAKVEFTPAVSAGGVPDYANVAAYTMRVDEDTEPAWFAEHRRSVETKLRAIVEAMIIDDDSVPLVLDGFRILVDGARVREMKAGRVMLCGGTLTEMCGGTLTAMCGGTLTEMCGGTLATMRGGTLTAMWGGTLTAMWGGTLTAMWGGTLTEIGAKANVPAGLRKEV